MCWSLIRSCLLLFEEERRKIPTIAYLFLPMNAHSAQITHLLPPPPAEYSRCCRFFWRRSRRRWICKGKGRKRGEGEGGLPASNDRLTELGDRVGEVLPKLDDIYIRVLPALEDIKQRARKESERENLTLKEVREQAEKVEKIMDMVEDLKEGGMGKSGMQSME